jgi:pyruvate/2-oxoglutarate dehydrogenase complex dihydrolipoamide acyltransferase (E2) component
MPLPMKEATRSNDEATKGPSRVSLAETEIEAVDTETIEVTMPETESARPARVIAWHKQPGEPVAADEPLCMVYYAGSKAEVASPASGVLRMLAVGPGSAAPTGITLTVLDVAAGAA